MRKVFIGGSRKITRLNATVTERIDNIIANNITVLIGDANGADKAVQLYLNSKSYKNVVIYCSGKDSRNNIGNWPTTFVETGRTKKDYLHYVEKDKKMSYDAEYGFFLWDGKSKGTLGNILRLIKMKKCSLLYFSPLKKLIKIKEIEDILCIKLHFSASIQEYLNNEPLVSQKQLNFT